MKQTIDVRLARKLADPPSRNGFHPVGNAGQAAGDTSGGVRVAAEVDGFEHTFVKVPRPQQAPQTGLQRMENITP